MLPGRSSARDSEDRDCAFLQCFVQTRSVAEITVSVSFPSVWSQVEGGGSSGIQLSIHKKLSWPVDLVYFPHSTLFSVVRSFMCCC